MPRRNNPVALARTYSELLEAGIVKEKPAWLPVLQLYPPAPAPTRSITPGMVFRPKEPSQNAIPTMFPSRNHNRRLGAKLMIRELQQRPPRIEYPEDDLRRRFYEEHPFELVNKPATLVEDESKLRDRVLKTWDSVEAGELNGEAVVKHALYLRSTGMDMKEAYIASVKAYRLARAREEKEQLERKAAKGILDSKPAMEKFRNLEDANLKRSLENQARDRFRGPRGGSSNSRRQSAM